MAFIAFSISRDLMVVPAGEIKLLLVLFDLDLFDFFGFGPGVIDFRLLLISLFGLLELLDVGSSRMAPILFSD